MPGTVRKDIKPGTTVDVVQKQDQGTGKLTRGVVKDLLTNSPTHPRGIKVRLQDGRIGRVQAIISQPSSQIPAKPSSKHVDDVQKQCKLAAPENERKKNQRT